MLMCVCVVDNPLWYVRAHNDISALVFNMCACTGTENNYCIIQVDPIMPTNSHSPEIIKYRCKRNINIMQHLGQVHWVIRIMLVSSSEPNNAAIADRTAMALLVTADYEI